MPNVRFTGWEVSAMLLNLLAYFIIPAYTLLFVKGYGWFTTNFSVIGNYIHRRDAFVLWGLIVGSYFFYTLSSIVRHMDKTAEGVPSTEMPRRRRTKRTPLITVSLVLLFCAITTPYLPEELPLKSFLHIIFAFLAAVLLLVCLIMIIWHQYLLDPERYGSCLYAWAAIVAGSAFLLILVGIVSSALEIYYTVTTVILTRILLARISSSGQQDSAGR